MAHSLAPVTPLPVARLISRKPRHFALPSTRSTLKVSACATPSGQVAEEWNVQRRTLIMSGLGLPIMGLIDSSGTGSALAAARRPPPPPPQEKKDPNVSGTMAKIMASKKRKEAMKETVAKLREKGKIIDAPAKPEPVE